MLAHSGQLRQRETLIRYDIVKNSWTEALRKTAMTDFLIAALTVDSPGLFIRYANTGWRFQVDRLTTFRAFE